MTLTCSIQYACNSHTKARLVANSFLLTGKEYLHKQQPIIQNITEKKLQLLLS